jgi:type II secretory pathway component PulM
MKDWFLSLQERERVILIGGAATALVIVLWWAVLAPLQSASADLREAVTDKQRLLLDLRRAETLAPDAAAPAAGPGGQSLVVLVESTTQAFGLALPRTRQDGANGINVSFQGASFDALLAWLIELDTTHGVRVESASFSSARERGLVNGQLFLRRQ